MRSGTSLSQFLRVFLPTLKSCVFFSKTVRCFETKYHMKASGSSGTKKKIQLGLVT